MKDEFKKFNPYHDPHTGRFTTKAGAMGLASVGNFYGVKLDQGKFYDLRIARAGGYQDPSTGTLIGDVSNPMKLRGRIEHISEQAKNGANYARIVTTHAIGAYSPQKIKRSVFFIDTRDVIDAKEVSPERAKIDEAIAVSTRGVTGTIAASVGLKSPKAAEFLLRYGNDKYGTTADRRRFLEFAELHVLPKSRLAQRIFRQDGPDAPPTTPDGGIPTGPAGPTAPKSPTSSTPDGAVAEPTTFIDRLRTGFGMEQHGRYKTIFDNMKEGDLFSDPDAKLIDEFGGTGKKGVYADQVGEGYGQSMYGRTNPSRPRPQDHPLYDEAVNWTSERARRANALTDDDMPDESLPDFVRDIPPNEIRKPDYEYPVETMSGIKMRINQLVIRTARKDLLFNESRMARTEDEAAYKMYQKLKIYRTARDFMMDKKDIYVKAARDAGVQVPDGWNDQIAYSFYSDTAYGSMTDPEIIGEVLPKKPPNTLFKHQSSEYLPGRKSMFSGKTREDYARDVYGQDANSRDVWGNEGFDWEADLYFDPDRPQEVITGADFSDRYWVNPADMDYPSIRSLRQQGVLPPRER
jgi:hypothetical protein